MAIITVSLNDEQKGELEAKATRLNVRPDELIRLGVERVLQLPDSEARLGMDEVTAGRLHAFADWYEEWRSHYQVDSLMLDPDVIFADVRDSASGREFTW